MEYRGFRRFEWNIGEYRGIHEGTGGYIGCTGRYKGIEGRGYRAIQGDSRGKQRYTGGYKEIQRDGIMMDTKWYSGDTGEIHKVYKRSQGGYIGSHWGNTVE